MIETRSLTKRYGSFRALDDCNLLVHSGEVFGLLGPNGAGKTTLIRLLLGFLQPTSGSATIDQLDCTRQSVHVRQRLSYLPAEAKLFRRMRGRDALRFFAGLRAGAGNLARANELADRLDLDTSRRIAMMSTGMRQKLALAMTLANETPLLILDEPTANLDPNVRAEVMHVVKELKAAGRTILLSSHVLPEIEEVCDRVAILRAGQMVHLQSMDQLRRRHRIEAAMDDDSLEIPEEFRQQVDWQRKGDRVQIETEGDLADVLPWLSRLKLKDMAIEPYGLRAVYNRYHAARDEE